MKKKQKQGICGSIIINFILNSRIIACFLDIAQTSTQNIVIEA